MFIYKEISRSECSPLHSEDHAHMLSIAHSDDHTHQNFRSQKRNAGVDMGSFIESFVLVDTHVSNACGYYDLFLIFTKNFDMIPQRSHQIYFFSC